MNRTFRPCRVFRASCWSHAILSVLFILLGARTLSASPSVTSSVQPERPIKLRAGQNVSFLNIPPPEALGSINAQTSTFEIDYVSVGRYGDECGTWPEAAKTALEYAVHIWELYMTSAVPITIEACWVTNMEWYYLGGAGALEYQRDFTGAPTNDQWFAAALANKLAGEDLNPALADGYVGMNGTQSWYLGTDGNPTAGTYDFATVMLHELAHALGFIGSMYVSGGLGSWGWGTAYPFIYDSFAFNGSSQQLTDTDIFANNSAALAAQLTGGDIYFTGANAMAANSGNPVKLFAPGAWMSGSSYSHVDDIYNDTENALMTYSVDTQEVTHSPGPILLGMMQDIGWELSAPDADLTIQQEVVEGTTLQPGEAITIVLSLANDGLATASEVTVTDVLPTEIIDPSWESSWAEGQVTTSGTDPYTWSIPDMAPGETGSITVHGTIDPALADDYSFSNTASIITTSAESDLTDNTSSETVNGPATPVITLSSPNGGQDWRTGTTHSITWTSDNLAGTATIQLLKSGVLYRTIGTADISSGSYSWHIPTGIADSDQYKVKISLGATSDLSDSYLTISGSHAELTVSQIDSADPVAAGTSYAYTVTISNDGPHAARTLSLGLSLPDTITVAAASGSSWSCSISSHALTCSRSSLAADASTQVIVSVTSAGSTNGSVTSSAVLSSSSFETSALDNTSTETTQVLTDSDGDESPDILDKDDDNDGLLDDAEEALGTDPLDYDSDDDDIADGQEVSDNSNPLDRGSSIPVLSSTLCSEWNGFLGGMWNVAEHMNMTSADFQVETTIYDINGQAASTEQFTLPSGRQLDLLVHDLNGWTQNSYGKVCSTVVGGEPGDIDGRMVYYKESAAEATAAQSFQFAFAMPFSDGIHGSQFVPFNTFQPSLDPVDAANQVANWVQLTNLSGSAESGTLRFYAQDGSLLHTELLDLAAGARRDFAAHEFGPSLIGLAEWRPENSDARFQLRNVRYFYDNPLGTDSFNAAFQLEGMIGSGELLAIPLDTTTGSSIIEVANTKDSSQNATVRIYDSTGLLLKTERVTLAAHASYHLVTDQILLQRQGIALIEGSSPESIIALVMQYRRTDTGGIRYLYGILGRQPLGDTLRGSYNTFLSQGCRLLLVNPRQAALIANVSMIRSDGSRVLSGSDVTVPAHGLVDYDLCSNDAADNYGIVAVVPETSGSLVASTLRVGPADSYRFPTLVRP